MVKSIAPQDVGRKIVSSDRPVLVAFLRRGRRHQEQRELLLRAARRYNQRVNCYFYSDTFLEAGMKQHFVSGTPTYLFFQAGWEVDRLIGCSDDEKLDSFLNRCLVDCD